MTSTKLIGFYTSSRTALYATPVGGRYMPYRLSTLREQMSGAWMIFVEMLKNYRAFKLKLEPLAGSDFNAATDNFRNAYNHGFSSRFVIGFTQAVRREVKDGLFRYALGGTPRLGIDKVADFLEIEPDQCY